MSWKVWLLIGLSIVGAAIFAEAKWRSRARRRLTDAQPDKITTKPSDVPLGMEATDLETVNQAHTANAKAQDYNRSISRKLSR